MIAEADRIVLRVRGGARLAVPATAAQITSYVLLEQEDWFEEEIRFVRRRLGPGMRAIDVGASFGIYTVAIARAVGSAGRVWAFEPTPRTAEYLQFNLELNDLAQVTLARAALSNRSGRVTFNLAGPVAETNAIAAGGNTVGETTEVDAVTLDQAAAEHGWKGIDFVKLDVEGHELEAIEGGAGFLHNNSPLVMLEIRDHGGQADLRALHRLAEMGYQPYRLLPGPLILAPFDGELDPSQLNLFACKKDRAKALAAQGALAADASGELASPSPGAWADSVGTAPHARDISSRWPQPAALAEHHDYYSGLAAFAQSQAAKTPPERFGWLTYSFQNVAEALRSADTLARRMTFARLAWELGARTEAIATLKQCAEDLAQNAAQAPDEPFLAPSPRYESVPAQGDLAGWCRCAVVEQYEKQYQHSSYFAPEESLPNIESIIRLPHRSPEMDRRRQLVRFISGAQSALHAEPRLVTPSDENLNPEFWSRS